MMLLRAFSSVRPLPTRNETCQASALPTCISPALPCRWQVFCQYCAMTVDKLLLRHRIVALLFLCYLTFIYQVSSGVWKKSLPMPDELRDMNGTEMIDPLMTPPLVRATVLNRNSAMSAKVPQQTTTLSSNSGFVIDASGTVAGSKAQSKKTGGKLGKSRLRQEKEINQVTVEISADAETDDPAEFVMRGIQLVSTTIAGPGLALQQASMYTSAANLYSTQGRYSKARDSMGNAVQAAKISQDADALVAAHANFGRMELKHYRYSAAELHFENAFDVEAMLDNASMAPLLSGSGSAAIMQQGGLARAEASFLDVLDKVGPHASGDLTSGIAAPAQAICRPQLDGLDGDRAVALSGLCLTHGQRKHLVALSENDRFHPTRLCDCAAKVLGGTRSFDHSDPIARRALGFAWQTMSTRGALREQRRATLEEQHLAPAKTSCVRLLSFGAGKGFTKDATDLMHCSHSAFNLGFAEYVGGDKNLGLSYVDQFLHGVASATRKNDDAAKELEFEVSEWLIGFGQALGKGSLRIPAADDFAALLLSRSMSLVVRSGATNAAALGQPHLTLHLAELGRLLKAGDFAKEQVLDSLNGLEEARIALDESAPGVLHRFGWPRSELSSFHRLFGLIQYKLGQNEEAVKNFQRTLDLGDFSVLTDDCISSEEFVIAYAEMAVMRLQTAGNDNGLWRGAVDAFRGARRMAREGGLDFSHPVVHHLEVSYRKALRLAHRRGAYAVSPRAAAQLFDGPICKPKDVVSIDW